MLSRVNAVWASAGVLAVIVVALAGVSFSGILDEDVAQVAIEEPSAEKPAVGAGTAAPAPDATVTASGHDQPVASAKATEDAGPASDQTQSEESIVEPDLNYESALASAGISTFGWLTDFSKHTVTYDEIVSGGPPRDGIPPPLTTPNS